MDSRTHKESKAPGGSVVFRPPALAGIAESESRFLRSLLCVTIACSTFQKTFWYVAGYRVLLSDFLMVGFCFCYLLARLLRKGHSNFSAGNGFLFASVPLLLSVMLSGFVNTLSRIDLGLYSKGVVTLGFYLFFQLVAIKFISETTNENQVYYPLSFIAGAMLSVGYSAAQGYFLAGQGIDLDTALLERFFSPAWHEGVEEFGAFYRLSGLLADPNHFGIVIVAALGITIGFLIYRHFGDPKPLRAFLLTAALSLFVALVFTFSRTALVAFTVMLLTLVLLAGGLWRWTVLKVLMPLFVFLLLAAGILLYSQKDGLMDVFSYKLDPSGASVIEHASLYSEGLFLWTSGTSTLLFGVGPNNFSAAYQRHFGEVGENAHSSWMTELTEGGLFGFVTYSWLVFYILRSSYLLFVNGQRYSTLGLAYTAALSGVLAGGFFYDLFHWNYIFILQLLAVGLRERDVPRTLEALSARETTLRRARRLAGNPT